MDMQFPSGFQFRKESYDIRVSNLIRECHSNASNYKATDTLIIMTYRAPYDYLLYWHNGTMFSSMEGDILKYGCTPNLSGQQGASFQGAGLVASAIAAHPSRDQLLLVGSRLPNQDGFAIGTGKPAHGNRWVTTDETEEWWPIVQGWMGDQKYWSKYNVFYGFRILWEKPAKARHDSRTALKPKQMATVAYLSRGPRPFTVHYCEQAIGYPYEDANRRRKRSSFTAVRVEQGSGDVDRIAVSLPAYQQMYRGNRTEGNSGDGIWEIQCEPFNVELQQMTDDLRVTKARIVVEYYPADKKSDEDSEKGSWMVNLRDVEIDGRHYKKGGGSGSGAPPTHHTFLYCPWVYEWAKKNDPLHSHYQRFSDNALATYGQYRLFADMGLSYKKADKGPFMVVSVFLDELELNDPYKLFDALNRAADFTFQHRDVDVIMRKAAEAAKPYVPQDLKDLCDRLYEPDDGDFPDLEMGGSGLVKDCSRQSNIKVYSLETAQSLDKAHKTGVSLMCLFHDTVNNRYLEESELQVPQFTRGVELCDMTKSYSFANPQLQKNLQKLVDDLKKNSSNGNGTH